MTKRIIPILILLVFAVSGFAIFTEIVRAPVKEREPTEGTAFVKSEPRKIHREHLDTLDNDKVFYKKRVVLSASDALNEYIKITMPVFEAEGFVDDSNNTDDLLYYEEYEEQPDPVVYNTLPYVEESVSETNISYTYFTEDDVIACAQMLWGEARGCSVEDMKNCVRTVCNRCDDVRYPDTIYGCVSQPDQYYGYSAYNPIDSELYAVAYQVLSDWSSMKSGESVEWNSYNSFYGNGTYNTFYST